jgi:hypothetical protein
MSLGWVLALIQTPVREGREDFAKGAKEKQSFIFVFFASFAGPSRPSRTGVRFWGFE